MPIPASISDLSATPTLNSPQGTESAKGTVDDYFRTHAAFIRQVFDVTAGATVTLPSAASVAIGFAASNNIAITGTTTITAFDIAAEGTLRNVQFSGVLTLTHNAASMILPGGVSIVTASGDFGVFKSLGGGSWKCLVYQRIGGLLASQVANTPAGNLAATTVQAALNELDAEKLGNAAYALRETTTSSVNANTWTANGSVVSYAAAATNTPTASGVLTHLCATAGTGDGYQMWQEFGGACTFWQRQRWGGVWTAWQPMQPAQTSVPGSSGSCTGNAATATTAANALGVGQSWQLPARALSTPVTNSTGRSIQIVVCLLSASTGNSCQLEVGGVIVQSISVSSNQGNYPATLTAIVPPGNAYQVVANNMTITSWAELR